MPESGLPEEYDDLPELPPRFQDMTVKELKDTPLHECTEEECRIISEWILKRRDATKRWQRSMPPL